MYKFNNDNIITGYIKQLLHRFNLPTCKVFKDENTLDTYLADLANENNDFYVFYIVKKYQQQRDSIVKVNMKDKSKEFVEYYNIGRYYRNLTKTLELDNNTYTSYTHKYLGNFLTFVKDFSDINLLPLYNCYCNQLLEDSNYKYIIIPVKFNTTYTIKVNLQKLYYIETFSKTLMEINDDFLSNTIAKKTIPVRDNGKATLTTDKSIDVKELINEANRKIVIRIPKDQTGTIICLEGDYSNTPDYLANEQINYDVDNNEEIDPNKLISNLSLMKETNGEIEERPFADRLIEYLVGNVITDIDPISKNIIDAKFNLYTRYCGKFPYEVKKLDGKL